MNKLELSDRKVVLDLLSRQQFMARDTWRQGQAQFRSGLVEPLTVERDRYAFLVSDRFKDFRVTLDLRGPGRVDHACECGSYLGCCQHVLAALFYLDHHAAVSEHSGPALVPYTRAEMVERVLAERRERAGAERFRLEAGANIHGPHRVLTERHRCYEITLRSYEPLQGYCSCPDFKLNKLGTCKHIMFAHDRLLKKYRDFSRLRKAAYPCFEIYCDPLRDYRITYYYQGLEGGAELARDLFGEQRYLSEGGYAPFLQRVDSHQRRDLVVRPEVYETIEEYFEQEMLRRLSAENVPDLSRIRAELYPYQRDGVRFATFRKGAVIADDMGLGKTLQAIAAAYLKREVFGFRRALVVCPASLKHQWKREIERFTGEEALVVEGPREDRMAMYQADAPYFQVLNYETVLRDVTAIAGHPPDLVVLDEAQKIKNYETKTAEAVKSIPRKHSLVITGTPLENKLIDLYSIMSFVDPRLLSPLWEFSQNHCIFDREKKNKVTGYYNLQALKEKLKDVVIRREKREVLQQLPPIREVFVPVTLSPEQAEIHAGYGRSISSILRKKYLTLADLQRLQKLLLLMRMTCDSTYLIDGETNISPKLEELESILVDKLDLLHNQRKILIFSEWKDMLALIGHRLARLELGHVTLTGDVAVGKRGDLITEFENNPDCRAFLSTEAGGSGLNLQVADTVINFDLPWNPAKKNQRIGRIDRLGQKAASLLVVNLVAMDSIEARIADGIGLKQELFDAVLKETATADEVNFLEKGKATFLSQVRDLLAGLEGREGGPELEPADPLSPPPAEAELEPEPELEALGSEPSPSREVAQSAMDLTPAAREGGIEESRETSEARESGPLAEDGLTPAPALPLESAAAPEVRPAAVAPEVLEQTLNQGLAFLSGIMQLATGQALGVEGQSIQLDRATGEVTLKFRLPRFEPGLPAGL